MKTLVAIVLLGAVFLTGCEPAATFTHPQPAGVPVLSAFPNQLQGIYADPGRTSLIKVSDRIITSHYELDKTEHKDSLGAESQLTGDTLIFAGTKYKNIRKGDSVIRRVAQTDTLVYLSEKEVLKKFKGRYFISTLHDTGKWEVNMLTLSGNILTLSAITENDAIAKIREIADMANDTVSNFSPTKSQFRRFVKGKVFSPVESFVKIN